jgi:hypothetical protein
MAELDVVGDEGVEDGIRDLVADLVGWPSETDSLVKDSP